MTQAYVCDNCETNYPVDTDLPYPKHLYERLDPGGEAPAGECLKCGALCYLVDDEEGDEEDEVL